MDMDGVVTIGTADELREIVGEVQPAALRKERTKLHPLDFEWLAASPFCLIATSDATGACDVSPKGDPPGFTRVLDEGTIAIPDRPGNRRVDTFRNVLTNPHVGLVYFIPGRGDTLRINGRATLVRDAPFFDDMKVKGHRPKLALIVAVEQVFHHCSKAFLRSKLWKPESWEPESAPPRPVIAKTLERPDDSLEELERYYGPAYADKLYG
ncbi:pyridoxamine 5'-phosphate oxidase family protein [Amycolatopsis sp.]|uniref:pyridoxamine 5'-phosphate oxidase family protein n=1 Tax=Amycolatopsis sp. TaxID=37632 RepID=UPI002C2764FF|nr:pyridoxamine 5'-phosphate oxidase family protein [Amycolatopsis sp.]HVV10332.1 pyridoxamine 5'-phosphate oxidase family protein [Amycolatopsis sp.]